MADTDPTAEAEGLRRLLLRHAGGERALLAGLVLYLAVVSVWPLARLLAESLGPGEDGRALGLIAETWTSRAVGRAFVNTLVVSLSSSLISAALGTVFALLVRLTDIRGKALVTFIFMLPMLIPPQITALAWIELFGASSPVLRPFGLAPAPGTTNPLYSRGGIIFVMGVEHSTLVFLAVAASLRNTPRDLVEAARLFGCGRARAVLSIVLPLAMPSVLAGGALAFVSSIGNFGIPALLGIPGRITVLTTLIYQRLNGFGPSVLGEVGAIALILVALAAAGLAGRAFLNARNGAVVDRTGAALEPFALGRLRPVAEAVAWLLLLGVAILPLLALIGSSLTPAIGVPLSLKSASFDNYRFAVIESPIARRAFVNSFVLAALAAVISAFVAVPLAYLSAVRARPIAKILDAVADGPYAVPGTVLAIGIIIVFLPPLPLIGLSIYGTSAIILVAYLGRFLPLVLRPVGAALETMEPALDEAGRVLGVRSGARLAGIILPVAAPHVAVGGLLIFMTALNELTVSSLLWSTGVETLGVVVFSLQYEGNSPAAAALATTIVFLMLLLALIFDRVAGRMSSSVMPWRV